MKINNYDESKSPWRSRMLAKLAEGDKQAAIRYHQHLTWSAIIREMINLQASGQLTDAKWIEFRDRGLAVSPRATEVRQ